MLAANIGSSDASPDDAGKAAFAVAQLVEQHEIKTLAMPLFSRYSGHAEVLRSMILALGRQAPYTNVDQIILVAPPESALIDFALEVAQELKAPQASIRALFNTDQPGLGDSLKFSLQVENFAKLVAARDVQLPLAIGLFGNWGVGKTHFMTMMRGEVKKLTDRQDKDDSNSTYMRRIAQIDFNAWHYVDTNLWATLALRIFDGLSEAIARKPEDHEVVRSQLRTDVESNMLSKGRAKRRQLQAQEQRRSAMKKLASLQKKRKTSAKALFEVLISGSSAPVDAAKKIAGQFGLSQTVETVEDAVELSDQLQALRGRGQALVLAFGNRFSNRTKTAITIGVVVVVLLLVSLEGPMVDWLLVKADGLPFWTAIINFFCLLTEGMLQLTTLGGVVIAWVGRQFNALSKGMGYLETVQSAVEKAEPVEHDDVAKHRKAIREFDEEIRTAQQQAQEAGRRISEAQTELQRINAGGLVYDFVEGRAVDSDYLENLGLISTIREDFNKLKDLLQDWYDHYDDKIKGKGRSENKAESVEGEATPPEQGADTAEHPALKMRLVERIILYIDDLDRCHPDKVVEVLQAVHLLMAFDLFVVVAVDPRWLERSLYKAYAPEMLKAEINRARLVISDDFSPQNYLEKIFQIPFSVPAMNSGSFSDLIGSLITTRAEYAEKQRGEREEERKREEARKLQEEENHEEEPESEVGSKPVEQPEPPREAESNQEWGAIVKKWLLNLVKPQREVDVANKVDQAADAQITLPSEVSDDPPEEIEQEVEERTPTIERLHTPPAHFEEWEQTFLQQLFLFIGTPRLAKRMINLYRLLRVRAGNDDFDFNSFIDEQEGEYRAVMMLLAMNIGYPKITGRLLRLLEENRIESTSFGIDILFQLDPKFEDIQRDDWAKGIVLTDAEANEYGELVESLTELITCLDQLDPPQDFPSSLVPYLRWAPEVGRYSFYWHLE